MRNALALASALFAAPAFAADLVIAHSGRLLDADDKPVNSTGLSLTFAIYDVETPVSTETKLWDESYTAPVFAGVYSVDLGSTLESKEALPSTVFPSGAVRYLEITVEGQRLLPRLRIGTVPAAGIAFDVLCTGCIAESELGFVIDDVIEAGEIQTAMIDDGAVTDAKIDTVSASKITGQIIDAQIAGLSTSKLSGQVTSAQIENLSAAKLDGQVTDAQIAGLSTTKLSGLVTDAQIESLSGAKVSAPIDVTKLSGGMIDLALLPSIPYSKLTGTFAVPAAPPAGTPPTAAMYWDTATSTLKLWDGSRWISIASSRCGENAVNAAESCAAIKRDCGVTTSGKRFINAGGTAFETYCEMAIDNGGWTLVATVTSADSNNWTYYNANWTSATVLNETNLDVYAGGSGNTIDRKIKSYNTLGFTDVLITNADRSEYHVMSEFMGQPGKSYTSMLALQSSSDNWIWANRKTSQGSGMWAYTNWAFKNVETGGDQCWNARVAVCKQTYVGHTGAGSLMGTACSGGGSNNGDLAVQTIGTNTYGCITSGSEAQNLPIDNDTYYVMFVR